jgi:histidinol-phosphate aminotransferase
MPIDFQELPHPGIRSLVPYKPGKSIEELQREKGLSSITKMASNENPLGCSPKALTAIHNITSSTIATYPSAINHPLMPKLAHHLGVDEAQLFLSNGSDFIFGLLINCFALHTGKHILTHDYAFSTYAIQAHTLQVPVQTVPINPDWSVNITNLSKACSPQTGLLFIANPNNPTGLLISQKEIKQLLEQIPEETILVLDEAYYEYAAGILACESTDWLLDHPNLVITRTFSKIYGMAGVRLGYAIANPIIINLLQRIQLPFAVNQVALNAACAALDDAEFMQQSLQVTRDGMAQLIEGFKQLQLEILPSAGNFLTFNWQKDATPVYEKLLDQGIIIRPLHAYRMPNWLRVSIGTTDQNNRFLHELNNIKQGLL